MAEIIKKPAGFSTEKPDHIMLSINGDAAKQMAVTWRTDITVPCGFIEYREENTDKVICSDSVLFIPSWICSPREYTQIASVASTLEAGSSACIAIPQSIITAPALNMVSAESM